jgi:hypothetical protein
MKHYEVAYKLLEEASRDQASTLTPAEIDKMARKIAFALEVAPDTITLQDVLTAQSSRPPHAMAAIEIAARFRNFVGMNNHDPFHSFPDAVDTALGVTIFAIESKIISGASAIVNGKPFIFVSTAMDVDGLYVSARQLGNILLMPLRGKLACVEAAHEVSHGPLGPYKRFSDYFAMELLIPAKGIAVALKEVRDLLRVSNPAIGDVELLLLARIFGVSFLIAARRCEKVGILPRGGATLLNRILLEKHGGADKRAEEAKLPPRPQVRISPMSRSLASRTATCVREGILSLHEAERNLGWPSGYLAQLLAIVR